MAIKKPEPRAKNKLRRSSDGLYYLLRDGRKIIVPPSGGNFSKRQIERAVRTVVQRREEANAN